MHCHWRAPTGNRWGDDGIGRDAKMVADGVACQHRTIRLVELRPLRTGILAASASAGVLLTLATWHALNRASNVLVIVLVSFFVAAACEPIVNRLAARGMRRGMATGMILGGILAITGGILVAVGTAALSQLQDLRNSVPQLTDELESFVSRWTGANVDLQGVASSFENADVGGAVGDAALTGLRILGNVLAGLLVSFYLVVDGPRLRKRLCGMLPQNHQGEILRVWDLAVEKTGGYLAAKIILAGVSSVVHGVAFTVIGVPYALPLALWVGVVSQVVPVVGTYLAIGLPVVLCLASGDTGGAIAVVVIATIYQQIENSILAPRLTAQAVNVHPAVGFVCVLGVGAALGPAYTLLTIPVVATVQGFIAAYVKTHELIDDPRFVTGPIPVWVANDPDVGDINKPLRTRRLRRRSKRSL